MAKHEDDVDGHKPGVDPDRIVKPSGGGGGRHGGTDEDGCDKK